METTETGKILRGLLEVFDEAAKLRDSIGDLGSVGYEDVRQLFAVIDRIRARGRS